MGQVSRSRRRRYEMATYVILSRFSTEAFAEPKDFIKLADAVSSRIKKECKGVTRKHAVRFEEKVEGTRDCGKGVKT